MLRVRGDLALRVSLKEAIASPRLGAAIDLVSLISAIVCAYRGLVKYVMSSI